MEGFWDYEFMRHALISALILGPTCAFFGVFITLRGMSFFSDAIAHSALTGVALGLLMSEAFGLSIDLSLVVLLFSLGLATLMAYFVQRTPLPADTVIAFSFTGSVALGVLVVSKLGKYRMLEGMLFGDIYANSISDLWIQSALAICVFGFLLWNIKTLTLGIIHPDLARSGGMNTGWVHYGFSLLIAATVAVCIKMLGALLISALIVIPAAGMRLIAGSFRQLMLGSLVIGCVASSIGVFGSFVWNTPTGPTIVLSHIAVLLICYLLSRFKLA